jgi:hypothetical protein
MKHVALILMLTLATAAFSQELPSAPTPQAANADGSFFHRSNDVLFGSVISLSVGTLSNRPALGLVAGLSAGVINEARYGRNFNVYHLALISAGALAGYGISRLIHNSSRRRRLAS